jgi:hypothetical protein
MKKTFSILGVDELEGQCSFCYLQRLKIAAIEISRDLRFNPATSQQWPHGVAIRVDGTRLGWISRMPTECRCGPELQPVDFNQEFERIAASAIQEALK